jgi:hypothetical protein
MTTNFGIAINIDDLSAQIAETMFEDFRRSAHDMDDQLAAQGVTDATFILLLLSRMSVKLTEYTAYMASGLYLCTHGEEVARASVQALLRDHKRAAVSGMEKAGEEAGKIMASLDETEKAVSDFLQKAAKKCH